MLSIFTSFYLCKFAYKYLAQQIRVLCSSIVCFTSRLDRRRPSLCETSRVAGWWSTPASTTLWPTPPSHEFSAGQRKSSDNDGVRRLLRLFCSTVEKCRVVLCTVHSTHSVTNQNTVQLGAMKFQTHLKNSIFSTQSRGN